MSKIFKIYIMTEQIARRFKILSNGFFATIKYINNVVNTGIPLKSLFPQVTRAGLGTHCSKSRFRFRKALIPVSSRKFRLRNEMLDMFYAILKHKYGIQPTYISTQKPTYSKFCFIQFSLVSIYKTNYVINDHIMVFS